MESQQVKKMVETRILKNHLEKVKNSGFFYAMGKKKMRGVLGQEVIDDQTSGFQQGLEAGMVKFRFWSTNPGCHGPSHQVPVRLLIKS